MRQANNVTEVSVTKDSETEGPVPSVWRPIVNRIVDAFLRHDYRLANGISGVAPVSEQLATKIRDYVNAYGATLVALPATAWDTAVCIWTGDYWDVLIDLWTKEEGPSDLVLQLRVSEVSSVYLVAVYLLYVP